MITPNFCRNELMYLQILCCAGSLLWQPPEQLELRRTVAQVGAGIFGVNLGFVANDDICDVLPRELDEVVYA